MEELNIIQTRLNKSARGTNMPHAPGVYEIINPAGEIYVGGTRNLCKRFGQYAGKSFKGQRRLFDSFTKYGKENHTFSIVELCDESQLNKRERFWSHQLHATLNLIITGDSEHKAELSEETRSLIGAGNKGKIISEKCRRMVSEKLKGRKQSPEHIEKRKMYGERNPMFGKPSPMRGKHYPKNFSEMMSAKRKGRGLLGQNPNAKKVINTITGEIFGSIKEVCIKEGYNYSTLKSWLNSTNGNKSNYQFL